MPNTVFILVGIAALILAGVFFVFKKGFLGASVLVLYGVFLLVFLPREYAPVDAPLYYFLSGALLLLLILLPFLTGRKEESGFDAKTLANAGLSLALSFVLSYIKIFDLWAEGGSVTLASLLPLMLFSYRYGVKKGTFIGIIYGLLQLVQNPQLYEPMQVLLDYPVAFGFIGLAGLGKKFAFSKKTPFLSFLTAGFLAVLSRYASHFLSGCFVFSAWKWDGFSAAAYSATYNLYTLLDFLPVAVVASALFSSRAFQKYWGLYKEETGKALETDKKPCYNKDGKTVNGKGENDV